MIPCYVRGAINLNKIQPCRNGCGQLITVAEHEGKWKPFNVSEDGNVQGLHDCPNSTWNKNKATQSPQPTTGWAGTTKGGQMFEAKISQETNRAQMEINNIILKMLTDSSQLLEQRFYELNERTKRMEETLQVMYIAGKYSESTTTTTIEEPKTAAQEMTEQEQQPKDSTSHEESDYVL